MSSYDNLLKYNTNFHLLIGPPLLLGTQGAMATLMLRITLVSLLPGGLQHFARAKETTFFMSVQKKAAVSLVPI